MDYFWLWVSKKGRGGRDQYEMDCSLKLTSRDAIWLVNQRGLVGLQENWRILRRRGSTLGVLESGRPGSSPGSIISTSCVMIGRVGACLVPLLSNNDNTAYFLEWNTVFKRITSIYLPTRIKTFFHMSMDMNSLHVSTCCGLSPIVKSAFPCYWKYKWPYGDRGVRVWVKFGPVAPRCSWAKGNSALPQSLLNSRYCQSR